MGLFQLGTITYNASQGTKHWRALTFQYWGIHGGCTCRLRCHLVHLPTGFLFGRCPDLDLAKRAALIMTDEFGDMLLFDEKNPITPQFKVILGKRLTELGLYIHSDSIGVHG